MIPRILEQTETKMLHENTSDSSDPGGKAQPYIFTAGSAIKQDVRLKSYPSVFLFILSDCLRTCISIALLKPSPTQAIAT